MSAPIRNAFASYETTSVTIPSGFTLKLYDEITARHTFDLLKRMQEPDDTFANFICTLFISDWDITLPDSSVAAISELTLDEMSFRVRREIQTAVDTHARAYLSAVLPEILTEATEDSPLGESPTTAKKPRRTRA